MLDCLVEMCLLDWVDAVWCVQLIGMAQSRNENNR
jgi:hypothetical protein